MSKIVVFDHDGTLVNTQGVQKFLFDGMKELLSELKKSDVELFVWTARSRASTIEILKRLGIIGAFSELYCGNDEFPKPDARGLSALLEGHEARDVLIVGDTYIDMIGAKSFGAFAIGALWDEGADAGYLKKYGADALITHPKDLLKLVNDYFQNKEK